MSVLETTRASRFVPGSNLKGAVSGASWWFLLPSLEADRVVCLGAPSRAALATFARMSGEVVVVAPGRHVREIREDVEKGGPANVRLLGSERGRSTALPDAGADVVFARRPAVRRRGHELQRLLKPTGLAYIEGTRRPSGIERGATLWLGPAAGEVWAATPDGDGAAIAYLERHVLRHGLRGHPLLRHPHRYLSRHRLVNRIARRRAALVGDWGLGDGPPRYLSEIAAEAGVELVGRRWGLAAPGDYPSQKVLFFLFDGSAETPEHVVKITRDPSLNSRLENEWRALSHLGRTEVGAALPRPAFLGHEAGLAVLGETAIDGVFFVRRTHRTPCCPYARAAADWLVELGAATAHPPPGGTAAVGAALEGLLAEFTSIYRIGDAHKRFLAEQVAVLAGAESGIPLVFQHGDPGPWNVIVTRDGAPAFLDWEAAEPEGMPLWDLFHFLRSYGRAASRASGTQATLRAFAQQFLAGCALTPLVLGMTRRACAAIGLSPRLVEPLFHLCWMQRALKEAARLSPDRLDEGRYVNLLRLGIEGREAAGLRRLFSLAPGDDGKERTPAL